MSGAQYTNLFLEGYSKAHRDAIRAEATAQGRTLSVKNPNPGAVRVAKITRKNWWKFQSNEEAAAEAAMTFDKYSDAKSLLSVSSAETTDQKKINFRQMAMRADWADGHGDGADDEADFGC